MPEGVFANMKTVILLAGKGRRMGNLEIKHKSLTILDENTMLYHLIKNIEKTNIEEIIPIVGYHGEYVLDEIEKAKGENITVTPIWNLEYEKTNNLYSLYQAREILDGEEFLSINGDMIFDYHILWEIMEESGSQIAVDDKDYTKPVDSPGIVIKEGKIVDLGRHIPFNKNNGYAVGIYRYAADLSSDFFAEAEKMLDENRNAGFHDPLVNLFPTHFIRACSVKDYPWTDIDEEKDVEKAKRILEEIKTF